MDIYNGQGDNMGNSQRNNIDSMIGISGFVTQVETLPFEDEKFHITVDQVNHPAHYTSDPSGVECIQITRHRNFNIGRSEEHTSELQSH